METKNLFISGKNKIALKGKARKISKQAGKQPPAPAKKTTRDILNELDTSEFGNYLVEQGFAMWDIKYGTKPIGLEDALYMSEFGNHLMVHVTNYYPGQNNDGEPCIQSTAMATDYAHTRNTVHITLNHIVASHTAGSWDDNPIIILSPLADVIARNGNPVNLNAADTFFSTHPDTGLVLPKQTRIIRPADNIPDGLLFQIDGNETKYKRGNYTPQEIEMILPLMSDSKRTTYENWSRGEFDKFEIGHTLNRIGATGRKAYHASKDKGAFLRKIFARDREKLLITVVRNMAAEKTAEHMGHEFITSSNDISMTITSLRFVGQKLGVQTSSDKYHWNSVYGTSGLEGGTQILCSRLDKICSSDQTLGQLGKYLATESRGYTMVDAIIRAIIANDKKIDFYSLLYDKLDPEQKVAAQNDKNLDETVKRFCKKQQERFSARLDQLKTMPGYEEFIQKLRKEINYDGFAAMAAIRKTQDY